jgi:antitoxin (DNA-binding transcriptional repressor) of toxin-antitoxin stability system
MYSKGLIVHMLVNVGFTDLRQGLAAKLDLVEKGDTILVERRGKVIAKIVPVIEPKRQPNWKRKITPMKFSGPSMSDTVRMLRDAEPW